VDHLILAATSRDPQVRPADAGAFLRATRVLRGSAEPAEQAVTAWTRPAAAGTGAGTAPYPVAGGAPYPGADDASGVGSHTMVVDAGYPGYEGTAYGAGGYDPHWDDHAGGGDGREPFLQRWLFSRRLAYLVAALVVLAAATGGAWWLTSGRYATVPAVANLKATAAEQDLRQAGFQVRRGTPVTDDNVPKGDVISAAPSGRTPRGATITLTLSNGPKLITMPQIPTTDTVSQAEAALTAAGFTVAPATKQVGVASNPVIGTVAATDPVAGKTWPENKPVTLEEVAGLLLPNLANQNINDAQQWAAQNQLTLQATQVSSTTVAAGLIVSQSPAPGTIVTSGQTINVQVSSGGPQVGIPNVQGQNCQQAQQALQQAGFQVSLQQGLFHQDQATGTNPSGQAAGGSAVVLMCGSNNPF
jgi:beta-lactam-binding protein with PASTA domain